MKVAHLSSKAIADTAKKLRNQKSKRGAIRVLNETRTILRRLAATSQGDARIVCQRLKRIFSVAIAVVTSKG